MKPPRSTLMLASLGLSLALNAAFLVDHARRGTIRRMFLRMDLVEAPADRPAYQRDLVAGYRKLPIRSASVVFAGDSLIYYGPWADFFAEIHNRGIPGETSALLLGRLGEITRARPRTMVLLTGANDFIQGVPIPQLLRNDRSILEKIRADSPETEVVVIGLLPIDPTFPGAPRYDNASVRLANRQLEALTREFVGIRFLDLTGRLADGSGKLRREFTEDGIHLTLDGYLAIREDIADAVESPGRPDAGATGSARHADQPPDRR